MVDPAHALLTDAPGPPAWPGDSYLARNLRHSGKSPKMRVLHVLSSANQLYSGIGCNLFELTLGMTERATFEFAIDNHCERNVNHLVSFCEKHGFRAYIGTARILPGSLDTLNEHLPGLLKEGRWDVIECLSWANSATNATLLEAAVDAAPRLYAPHPANLVGPDVCRAGG